MNRNWIAVPFHLLFWAFCLWAMYVTFAVETLEVTIENGVEKRLYNRHTGILPFLPLQLLPKAILFYVNALYLLPLLLRKRDWKRFMVATGMLIIFLLLVELGVDQLTPDHHKPPAISGLMLNVRAFVMVYLFFLFTSCAYGFAREWWRNEQERNVLAKEKLTAELNFLKAQVNPHFLFNTLNNLFALAEREGNEELSRGIDRLSQLMRYMLYESQASRVSLEKEITYLQSIIEIQQLRIDEQDDIVIAFHKEGPFENYRIAPLLLMPFVENAFKHGIHPTNSSFVRIDLLVEDHSLHFKVKNSLFKYGNQDRKEGAGIGLDNVQRRLELLYPNNHQLNIREEENMYTIELDLKLD